MRNTVFLILALYSTVCPAASSGGSSGPGSQPPQPSSTAVGDSDVAFVAKLVVVSFVLGATIKYGSLWIDAPFDADPLLALALVFVPPLCYAAYILLFRQQRRQQ